MATIISYNVYDKLQVEEKIAKQMFSIISDNMEIILKTDEKSLYKTWYDNCIDNTKMKTIVLLDKDEVTGYIQYLNENSGVFLSEIQIRNQNQGDGKTFRELMRLFFNKANIIDSTIIQCKINPQNNKSINVFKHIGFIKKEKNNYEIRGNQFKEWMIN